MDLTLIGSQIQELLIKYEVVILPGAGRLLIESLPASFLEDGKTIVPPKKVLAFYQDGEEQECTQMECWQKELSGKIQEALAQNGTFEIPGVGVFADNGAGETIFTVNEDFDFSPDNTSLESISLEIAVPVPEEPVTADPEPEVQETAAPEPEITEADVPEQAIQKPEIQETALTGTSMAGHDITAKKNTRKKWLMWITVVIAALAVMILFIILFKEDLRPLLEKLLYTKEELEIIQKWAAQ